MSWDWEKLKEQQRKRDGLPPQMDEFVKKFGEFKVPGAPLLILVILLVLIGSSMFYTIRTSEVGVVQRFGKFVRTTQPGLHFKLPAGIETVKRVNVRRVMTEEFTGSVTGYATANSNITLMLTGDLNVALVPWIVQYRIKDPYHYLFKVRNVDVLLRDMSEASMRLVVGDRSIDEVISKRNEIAVESQELLQKEMDQAETGIEIVTIEMKKTDVPAPVQPSLNEVNQATQEKEQTIYQAKEEYNKAIPAARGEADRTIKAAEGYALDRINRAKGDAARFMAVYEEYVKAKDVTRRRLYLEALKELLPKLENKYIVDADQKNLLPLLNLGKQDGGIK
ncbi:HflK protein [Desulfonema ishimotonii]|uniref:Protein HflK n=1 Tax=Desulfonema ishimotonii TaxID=45657 RepID=A0A401FQS1_9BACT|nr:FtsH protease activity modulator HflK [Desulfonema ishimotonii]GBC59315.1 HflK protein [Desulfonema ishimotonii]